MELLTGLSDIYLGDGVGRAGPETSPAAVAVVQVNGVLDVVIDKNTIVAALQIAGGA